MTTESAAQAAVKPCFRPGFGLPVLERHVTQAVIDAYAEASGDFNPIHVDPDYAGKGPYGRTIAHGLMTLAYAALMLNDWSDGKFDEFGELEVAFVGPVFADDTVEMTGTVEELVMRNGEINARCTISCRCGERKILVGTVYQPVENEKAS
ncbi:acyl dehydratase [Hoeflea sp. IMCC20628]|uniref:MaoC family dehydratase n=1 Tax=Hoeflea sp. IMCC20628 TaxID=1620421 RepID=UPI00063BD4AD|nr:MaoC family dehydratase [Hoeflea sp. IMCC20628]AKH98840.1 acyl dehydratase [Hoeflea sp. IMCC20628]